ncbi:MAG: hypothetical protein ACT6QS_10960 [Flavobacteriales bacterium]
MNGYAQPLTFRAEPVDTLKIISNSSYYHFDTSGTTTGVQDEYIIAFIRQKKQYELAFYQRFDYRFTFNPDTFFIKQTVFKKHQKVNRGFITDVLQQFESANKRVSFSDAGLTQKKFMTLTSRRHIRKMAKRYDVNWQFKRIYSSANENKVFFNGCQNIDTFNVYLSTVFRASGYTFITDVDDHFDVIISTEKNRYHYKGKYPDPYKQPWHLMSGNSPTETEALLNLGINRALVTILPGRFSRISSIQVKALTRDYIKWYFKRRGVIFHY